MCIPTRVGNCSVLGGLCQKGGVAPVRDDRQVELNATFIESNARSGRELRSGNERSIETCAVTAPKILDIPDAVLRNDLYMGSRDFWVVDVQFTDLIPPNSECLAKNSLFSRPGCYELWSRFLRCTLGRGRFRPAIRALDICRVSLDSIRGKFIQPGEQGNNGQESKCRDDKPPNRLIGKTKGREQLGGPQRGSPGRYGVETGYPKYLATFEFLKYCHALRAVKLSPKFGSVRLRDSNSNPNFASVANRWGYLGSANGLPLDNQLGSS